MSEAHIIPGKHGSAEVFTFEARSIGVYTVHAVSALDAMSRANHLFRSLSVDGSWQEKPGEERAFFWVD